MKIETIAGLKVGFLGDPHLGRAFLTGVPLDRRGERERTQMNEFVESLFADVDVNICLGDIFDTFVVPPEIVLAVASSYREAARARPNTWFVLTRGNHDASRDADKRSSFDLLYQLLEGIENIVVAKDDVQIVEHGMFRLGVVPWHPFINSKDMARKLVDDGYKEFDLVVGHWDRVTFEDNPHNAVPLFELRPLTKLVVSGHDHRPYDEVLNGVRVVFPGSMQPYAHGENDEDGRYVTLTLEELRAVVAATPAQFHDVAVRVLLKPGEQIDFPVDAWALTTKPIADNGEEYVDITMQTESFDMLDILSRCLTKHNVTAETSNEVLTMYQERRNAA
ncbi:metallophosphoesterase [Burkholderia territorii]|uniref:metallophosphoesterase n=1 Tax=Burkholderia territorii TaxID=1503055 RepID=UPI0009C10DBC|nr:metallophosphoesterase [Burkholderia territorii]